MQPVNFLRKNMSSLVKAGLCGGCVVHWFQQNMLSLWVCEGGSMSPTLRDQEVVATAPFIPVTWFIRPSRIRQGDIVILKNPLKPQTSICKRVLALPGDTVWREDMELVVDEGKMWVEGDNKEASIDSRDFGLVPMGLVQGIVVRKLRNPL